ncbi:MAG: hypothetical protein M3Y28_00160 [Armatimonadota bacterium]|nr:hypothetical protein [Armatimonadota bacterium]
MTATSPLRLMLWLKWTLTWRGYRNNRMKLVGAILSAVLFLPLSLGIAFGLHWATRAAPDLAPALTRAALGIVYLIWAVTPLLGFQLNESYDLTKLFTYPLSPRRIFLGSVLGSLLDLPVLLTLPTFAVLWNVFSPTPLAGVANAVLLALFLLHTLALGQAVTLALVGFLRSRRFRDITIILFPLLGMAYYIGQRMFFYQAGPDTFARLLHSPVWRVVDWLPPGYAASGLSAAAVGEWGLVLLRLGALALACALTFWAAATALQTLYLGDRGPSVARPRRETTGAGATTQNRFASGGLPAFVPADIAAVAVKEFLYLGREPQYKAMAVQSLYTVVAIAVPLLLPATAHGGAIGTLNFFGDWLLFAFSATLLLSLLPLLFNLWGGEGAAITVLFSFPTRRRSLLLGKNLAHGVLLLVLNVVGLFLVAGLTNRWGALPLALVWTLLACPVLLAAGNLVSVRFPHRMLVRGQRWSRGGVATAGDNSQGCAYAFLYLLAYGATFAALLPAAAAVLLPRLLGWSPFWYALTLPLAAVYAGGLYVILLGQAETWLLAREPEIAARIVPAD